MQRSYKRIIRRSIFILFLFLILSIIFPIFYWEGTVKFFVGLAPNKNHLVKPVISLKVSTNARCLSKSFSVGNISGCESIIKNNYFNETIIAPFYFHLRNTTCAGLLFKNGLKYVKKSTTPSEWVESMSILVNTLKAHNIKLNENDINKIEESFLRTDVYDELGDNFRVIYASERFEIDVYVNLREYALDIYIMGFNYTFELNRKVTYSHVDLVKYAIPSEWREYFSPTIPPLTTFFKQMKKDTSIKVPSDLIMDRTTELFFELLNNFFLLFDY